ncbi:MAG: hypothetical protein P4N59_32645 [Negativicutes bacterium]|nr:hypothetical protein [Negativicutes bacterium]
MKDKGMVSLSSHVQEDVAQERQAGKDAGSEAVKFLFARPWEDNAAKR